MRVDPLRVRRALSLFVSSVPDCILCTSLEGLGAELGNMSASIGRVPDLPEALLKQIGQAKALSGSISYAARRFTDLLMRLQEIEWKKDTLAYDPTQDAFDLVSDPTANRWRMFMALAVKDFHVDVGSLMDALGAVVIQGGAGGLKNKNRTSLPGWADIQSGTKRSYRTRLPSNLLIIVDDADEWWPAVKKVRDLLTHRDHEKIIFGHPSEGLLFQVYDRSMFPKIALPAITFRTQGRVVDFGLYSALVLSELITLLDDIGRVLCPMVGVNPDRASTMCLRGIPEAVYRSIERLLTLVS
ncbi:MAG: hypothetical protein ACE144_17045 [Thermodesulfobacteriota bacterium]